MRSRPAPSGGHTGRFQISIRPVTIVRLEQQGDLDPVSRCAQPPSTGDTLLVRLAERNEAPESGRIVVARRPDDGYVVKRLGKVERRTLELLSLNPAFPPIRFARRPGTILGTVILRWRMHN